MDSDGTGTANASPDSRSSLYTEIVFSAAVHRSACASTERNSRTSVAPASRYLAAVGRGGPTCIVTPHARRGMRPRRTGRRRDKSGPRAAAPASAATGPRPHLSRRRLEGRPRRHARFRTAGRRYSIEQSRLPAAGRVPGREGLHPDDAERTPAPCPQSTTFGSPATRASACARRRCMAAECPRPARAVLSNPNSPR